MENNEILDNLEVWILTYNRSEYLDYAIDSILNQRLKPKKISVFDNGSTDNTKIVIEKYSSISYYKNSVNNQLGVWHQIIEKTECEYVMMFHDDDRINLNYFKQVKPLLKANPTVVVCRGITITPLELAQYSNTEEITPLNHYEINSFEMTRLYFEGNMIPFASVIYKTKYLKRIDLQIDTFGKFFDRPLVIQMLKYGKGIYVKNSICETTIHTGQDSKTIKLEEKNCEDLVNLFYMYRNNLLKERSFKGFYSYYSFFLINIYSLTKWSGRSSLFKRLLIPKSQEEKIYPYLIAILLLPLNILNYIFLKIKYNVKYR